MKLSPTVQRLLDTSPLALEHALLHHEYLESPEYDPSDASIFLKINTEIPYGDELTKAYNAKMKEIIRERFQGGQILELVYEQLNEVLRQKDILKTELEEVDARWVEKIATLIKF